VRLVKAGQTVASRRRVFFQIVLADGISPALAEAGGQPEASADGAAWSAALIGTLTHVGNGRYYADLTLAAVATAGTALETRYKGAATAECPGDSVRVVAFDPDDAAALGLSKLVPLGAAQVIVSSPVAQNGDVTVVPGDSYLAADGRPIDWQDGSGTWPDLAGASVAVHAAGKTFAGSVAVASGAGKTVRWQPSAADTLSLAGPGGPLAVTVTLASGGVVTLLEGRLYVG
jgi:hypothetical protein